MAERRPDGADSPAGDSDPDAHKTHVFDVATALESLEDKDGSWVFSTQVHPQFKNINDPYGGWSAAVLARAMLRCARPGMELVSITTDFLSAVPDGPLHITVHSDRSGRGTEFWRAGLASEDSGMLTNRATAVLARRRDTVEWVEGDCPEVLSPEVCPRIELPLAWSRVIEIRPAVNHPFSGSRDTHSSAWVRFTPDRPLDSVALVALADTPMPRLFYVIERQVPVATVSMTIYLHATMADFADSGSDYLLIDCRGARGGRGFYDQHATIWSRNGRLMATTQQIVWYRTDS
ncbi:MAG: thioesterase family protein [Pseudomonadota bacterium]|nr:thioesterase family protein [Pseudomonadota bacterium]